jgi:hypothetical protein
MECQRLNMYTDIHKGVRRALFQTVMVVGAVDVAEEAGLAELQRVAGELFRVLRGHVENERRFVHPLYEEAMPGVARELTAEHEQQEANLAELDAHVSRSVKLPDATRRVALGLEFYRRLSLFVGDYLPHIYREEAVYMRNLWDLYSDEELRHLLARILNEQSREDLVIEGRLIVEGTNHQDRLGFMGAVADLLKPEVMEQMQQLAQQYLPPHELEKMMAAMGGSPA